MNWISCIIWDRHFCFKTFYLYLYLKFSLMAPNRIISVLSGIVVSSARSLKSCKSSGLHQRYPQKMRPHPTLLLLVMDPNNLGIPYSEFTTQQNFARNPKDRLCTTLQQCFFFWRSSQNPKPKNQKRLFPKTITTVYSCYHWGCYCLLWPLRHFSGRFLAGAPWGGLCG